LLAPIPNLYDAALMDGRLNGHDDSITRIVA